MIQRRLDGVGGGRDKAWMKYSCLGLGKIVYSPLAEVEGDLLADAAAVMDGGCLSGHWDVYAMNFLPA
jgi:hypothetical protein